MIPTTTAQVVILLVALVPGVVYRSVRVRASGRDSSDVQLSQRALRAFVASVVFDSLYAICARDSVYTWIATPSSQTPRGWGWVALLGAVAIPALTGYCVNAIVAKWNSVRQNPLLPDPGTTGRVRQRLVAAARAIERDVIGPFDVRVPWDARVPGLAPCWVRIRKVDGTFILGYLNSRSYISTFPGPPSLYLGVQADVDANGKYQGLTRNSKGLWYALAQGDFVEFLAPMAPESDAVPKAMKGESSER